MNAKTVLFTRVLPDLKAASPYLTTAAITQRVQELGLAIKPGTLPVYLTEATAAGLIHDAGRGWYSRLSEPSPLDSKPTAKLIRAVEKKFPLLDFTVWSTEQIRAYSHHLLARFVTFVHTDRDAMPSVAEFLRNAGYDVHLNPRSDAARQFMIREKTVVVRPKNNAQPHVGRHVTIEGLLVELFVESRPLNLMDPHECYRIFANLAGQSRISMGALLNYARERRPAALYFMELINSEFMK
ncbi:MAG: DUF6577 family protein [Verrucomicrobiota bacterium]